MRELGHGGRTAAGGDLLEGLGGGGGGGIPPQQQQMDSELEDYSSDESDESDEDVPDVNAKSPASYSMPFQGDTSRNYLKYGEKDTANSGLALSTGNRMLNKSTSAYAARNFQPAGQMGVKSGDVLGVLNQPMQAASVPNISPTEKQSVPKKSSSSFGAVVVKKDGNVSDSEVRRVPDISGKTNSACAKAAHVPGPQGAPSRKRGGASTDKEHKRMKRLLRNRVSAQQARERKKAYLSELELKSKELEQKNAELQEKVSTLQRENFMLRQIVKNTTLKNADGN